MGDPEAELKEGALTLVNSCLPPLPEVCLEVVGSFLDLELFAVQNIIKRHSSVLTRIRLSRCLKPNNEWLFALQELDGLRELIVDGTPNFSASAVTEFVEFCTESSDLHKLSLFGYLGFERSILLQNFGRVLELAEDEVELAGDEDELAGDEDEMELAGDEDEVGFAGDEDEVELALDGVELAGTRARWSLLWTGLNLLGTRTRTSLLGTRTRWSLPGTR
jgi:hypothetical protein